MISRYPSLNDSDFSLSSVCNLIILAVLQVVMIFVPLFFLVKNEEIFEFNKMIFTYGAVITITTVWIAKTIIEKKLIIKKTPFDWFIVLFLLSQLISTALSIHPRTSLFGYYTRFHGGLFSTISYVILFYATTTFVQKKHLVGFIGFILVGAFLSAAYAFPEHFGHSPSCLLLTNSFDASCWIQDVQTRVFGTFGQPNWLAAYLVLLLPIGAALAFFEKKNDHSSTLFKLTKQLSAFILIFLFFSTVLFTKSRSGFLGFAVSWAFFAIFLVWESTREKTGKIIRVSWVTGVLLTILLTALTFGTAFTPSFAELLSKLHPQQQVTSDTPPTTAAPRTPADRLEVGGTDSGEIRQIVWKGAIAVWKRNPLFGSGVETFAYSYYRDRPMEHNIVSEWDFLYNKAHNEELNFLATTGAFGLGAYLLLQGVIGWFLFKEAVFHADKNTRLFSAAVLTGLIGLHISNFFGFSTVMVTILMYTLPALVIDQIGDDKELHWKLFSLQPADAPEKTSVSWIVRKILPFWSSTSRHSLPQHKITAGQWVLISISCMIGLFLLVQVATIWFADDYYSEAKSAYLANDFDKALTNMKLAIELSPKEALYYELYSKIASQYAIAALEQNQNELGTQFANSAIQASDTSLKLNPVHLNFYKTRNQILVTLAQARPQLYDDALNTLHVAEQLSPTDAKLVYYQALVENAKGDVSAAKIDLNKAIEMKANYDSARFLLGQLLEIDKDYDGAKKQYQYILDHIAPNNTTVQQRIDAIATMSGKKAK